ncbi:MAG: metallophosphoesterase [Sedimentisphaerales bacterium]|nr:metallophosphoesterase [Sedimentisphaerales bacterium]
MAEIFYKPTSRRNFIKTGLAALGTIVTLNTGCTTGLMKNAKEEKSVRWAFLSDTHIPEDVNNNYRGFYPYRNLQKIVPDIVSALPDGITITGDLARLSGQPGDYINLKNLLEPVAQKRPVFMALGNHDDRQNFVKVFNDGPGEKQPVKDKHVVVANTPTARIIILDSLLYVNKVPGLLGKAQRQWLVNYLQQCDNTPTILCFHHTLEDNDGDLLDILRLYPAINPIRKVKAIIYGHSHVYGFSKFEGIHLINIPAVGYNFRDTVPVGWIEARLTAKGGDFKLHAAAGNTDNDRAVTKLTWRT